MSIRDSPSSSHNHAYCPRVVESEARMIVVKDTVYSNGIIARRYYSPSLNELPFIPKASCPNSESISKRVLCLPLYNDLTNQDQRKIIDVILSALA